MSIVSEPGVQYEMTVGGGALASSYFDVTDPSTGQVFVQAPACTKAELDMTMSAATSAFLDWSRDEERRREVLRKCGAAIAERTEEIARVHSREQGKPITVSIGLVAGIARGFTTYADFEIPRLTVQDDESAIIQVIRRPLGVVSIIRPWNGLVTDILATALLTGNTVVLKPSPFNPLGALALGQVLRDIVPPGVLNVVSGPDPLGEWLVDHPGSRGIAFTGSIETGRRINVAAARDLKRVILELGGNDAAILLDDVDPAKIARKIFWAAFGGSGQVCVAIKRLFVPESMISAVVDALAEIANEVRVGDPLSADVEMGPITTEPHFERVKELVADAIHAGAQIAAGGHPLDRPGYYFAPTILTGVREGVRIVDEEQFGPVLPVLSYRSVDEAVERANATKFGLGSSVWSADSDRAAAVADRLESGMCWINTHGDGVLDDRSPFGGIKESGLGSQNGIWGIYALTDAETMWQNRSAFGSASVAPWLKQ
jgi:acyl-CoA reductase-like NAD-dependent aldehyde dehydrogenase